MTERNMSSKCAGCSKFHYEVRILIALNSTTHVCNECVDMCHEIAHSDDYFVKMSGGIDGGDPCQIPEQCWCDKNNIGEPGVSCGDCPTRDYKRINIRTDNGGSHD